MRSWLFVLMVPVVVWAQTVEVTVDRKDSLYKCGEAAKITLVAKGEGGELLREGQVRLKVDEFADPVVTNVVFDLAVANPVTIEATLERPGFMLCTASGKLGEKEVSARRGAGFSPELIRPGCERPADFDEFWDGAMRRLEQEVELDARVERLDNFSNEEYESFEVSFATFGGKRVYGFLCVPRGEGPFPVRVNVPGAGPGATGPQVWLAKMGYISLVMNVHPFEPAKSSEGQKERYDAQNSELKERDGVRFYALAGGSSREGYFYYPIILGINRAVNWLAGHERADRGNFSYGGSSQGGGFGFYLCGLNRNFTRGVFHVPALTDLVGSRRGGASGWPKLVESTPAEAREAVGGVAPYFDSAHFAPRIECPVRVSVGFIDVVCPPAAVYAGYNMLRVEDRAIVHGLTMGHSVDKEIRDQLDGKWLGQK